MITVITILEVCIYMNLLCKNQTLEWNSSKLILFEILLSWNKEVDKTSALTNIKVWFFVIQYDFKNPETLSF